MESNGWVMWNMGTWLMTHVPRKLCKYTSEALQMNIWQFFADRLFEFFAVLLLGKKKTKNEWQSFFVTSLRLSVINFHKFINYCLGEELDESW